MTSCDVMINLHIISWGQQPQPIKLGDLLFAGLNLCNIISFYPYNSDHTGQP